MTDLDEQLQAVLRAEIIAVAVCGDRNALDPFHHEIGTALVRRAGFVDVSDVRVVEAGQGLAFGLEAADHPLGIHSRLDHLQRDLSADRMLLLGQVDHAHASFAEYANETIGTDRLADLFQR